MLDSADDGRAWRFMGDGPAPFSAFQALGPDGRVGAFDGGPRLVPAGQQRLAVHAGASGRPRASPGPQRRGDRLASGERRGCTGPRSLGRNLSGVRFSRRVTTPVAPVAPAKVSFADAGHALAATTDLALWPTADGGRTWRERFAGLGRQSGARRAAFTGIAPIGMIGARRRSK